MTRILKIFITGMLAMAAKLSALLPASGILSPQVGQNVLNLSAPLAEEVASSAVGWCPACEAKTT